MIGAGDARQDPNVVTGTFLLNGIYASVLFDSGADFSFISLDFKCLMGLKTSKLGRRFEIKLANGKNIITNEVARGCRLTLCEHDFDIDLLPVGLGSFDVVEGMGTGKGNAETLPMAPVVRHHVGVVALRSIGEKIARRQIIKLVEGLL